MEHDGERDGEREIGVHEERERKPYLIDKVIFIVSSHVAKQARTQPFWASVEREGK